MVGQFFKLQGVLWSSPGRSPIGTSGGGGGGGTIVDPTTNAGSAVVGTASYPLPANAIYVSLNGLDANPGTVSQPKRSFASAISAASDGGTLVYRGGSYNEGGDVQTSNIRNPGVMIDKQITIQNYPGEAVWFDGSVAFSSDDWTFDAATGLYWAPYNRRFDRSHRWKSGQDDKDSTPGSIEGLKFVDDNLNPCASWPDIIMIDGTQLSHAADKASVAAGKFWVEGDYVGQPAVINGVTQSQSYWFQGSKVWIKDNPAGHEIRYSNKTSLYQTKAPNVTLRGIGIRRYASYSAGFGVVYNTDDNATWENVWIEDVSATAVWSTIGANITYRNVTARRIGFGFCMGSQVNDILFDSVDLQYCNFRNFSPTGPTLACVKLSCNQGYTVRNSIVANSNCNGLWSDQTGERMYVLSCRIQNLGQHGVDVEGAANYRVVNSLFTNCGGIEIWNNDSDQGQVWNCTLIDSHRNIAGGSPFQIAQSTRRAWDPAYSWMKDPRQPASYYDQTAHPEHQYQCNMFSFMNNVVVQNSGGKSQGIFSCQSGGDKSSTASRSFSAFNPTMDSNVYWWATGTLVYPAYITTTGGNGANPNIYSTISKLHTAFPSLETNGSQPASNPVNSSFQLVDQTLHGKATAMPADIAALIGQTAGTKHAGCFLVGSPA